jgi:Reverse transcriptase (RNA-dependent DNA polymerase)
MSRRRPRPADPVRGYGQPGLLGVRGSERAQGLVGNRRDPSAQPASGKDRPYKPMVKSGGAQRESDGVVVPEAAQKGAVRRKGPDFGHAGDGGKRKGMAGTTRPKSPRGHKPTDNVRKLQRRLYVAAKRSPERRFHALYDRTYRGDVLEEAWRRVRSNRGAAGVDRETLADVEGYGVERMLRDLQDALRTGDYRPPPVRRRDIPKPDGGVRPLGIPTVRDRVAQQAAKLVLEPIFEADFLPSSYGYRPKRSATEALECIRRSFIDGCTWVLELDIREYFDSIDRKRLLGYVEERVSDRRVLKLVRKWLDETAARLPGEAPRPQSARRPSRQMDRRLVQRPRPVPTERHHSLSGGSVTMRRRPSASRVRENRTHGSKGEWGNGSAVRTPRP